MNKVYIKDMKMPKSCRACKFCDFRRFDKLNYCRILNESILVYRGKKQNNCPLEEIK